VKGKPWPFEKEKELRHLVEDRLPLGVIAAKLGATPDAVLKKCNRLGLEVVGGKGLRTTTSISLPKELPSVEETLMKLAGALDAACKPGLDKVEVQRLQVVATLSRTYKEILADYLDYRGVEAKLIDLANKVEQLAKKA
jgi:hypothetical protein